jgi:hypothetical protein
MNKVISRIHSTLSDMNYASKRLFEIQTGTERSRRNRGGGH